jgi:hypothetical protein
MPGFRGVYKHKDWGWTARLGRAYLGFFKTEDAAIAARKAAEIESFGCLLERQQAQVFDSFALIPLHGRRGVFYGWAKVDIADFALVSGIAWTLNNSGYVVGRPSGSSSTVALHRFIVWGGKPGGTTDHISGDKLDNTRQNLRKCTQKENSRNTRIAINNSSGAKGVRPTASGRFNARITAGRKEIHIGNYATLAEAAAAYDAAALVLHGDFASPNARLDKPGSTD